MSFPSLRGLWNECRATVRGLERWRCCMAFFSSAFLAFGLYHVHSVSGITEGGVLGATLLLDHWFSLSPAVSGFVLNLLCYGWGWRLLGRSFIAYSLIATVGFSLPYKLYELFPPLWPQLAEMPLLAAVVGALFVGVGAGLSVRAGGASGGQRTTTVLWTPRAGNRSRTRQGVAVARRPRLADGKRSTTPMPRASRGFSFDRPADALIIAARGTRQRPRSETRGFDAFS